ncbi:hypothetical protein EPUL_000669 [Erysiphe pulchra]|uniref:Uncharacterized protein n=1 Tax=Erysiphe pulchra TaxID=225359 RepID=A0A2S4PXV4_9PEZI|nr:hypothetical protein EPUL_000669 [Erysiphe pulchra]
MSEETPLPNSPPIPLPKKGCSPRPETSGTQLNLRTNREMASSAFKLSREQERIYITKRQAGFGKQEAIKAKEHLHTAQKKSLCGRHVEDQKQQKIMKRMEREEEAKKHLEKIAAAIHSTEEAPAAA